MKTTLFVFLLLATGLFFFFRYLIKSKKVDIKIKRGGIVVVAIFAAGVLTALYDLFFRLGAE